MYLRKSRADIEAEKLVKFETLGNHRRALTKLAENQGLRIVETYEEIASGETIKERSEMRRLLSDVYTKKYDGVLVMDVDRLGRGNAKDQGTIIEAFKYSYTLIITPTKTYDANIPADEEYLEFGQFMGRKELNFTTRRMQGGRMMAVEYGNYMGPIAPYGYDIDKRGRKDRTLKINENAKYVQMMFDWCEKDRLGCGEIARRLTAMNIPTLKGNKDWDRTTIKDILRNDIYTGKMRWNRRKMVKEFNGEELVTYNRRMKREDYTLVDGKHQAIISQEQFDEAQKTFNFTAPTTKKTMKNMFSGLIKCSQCGKAMLYQPYTARETTQPRTVHPENKSCTNRTSALHSEITNLILSTLAAQIEDFSLSLDKISNGEQTLQYEQLKASMEKELVKLKIKKDDLFELMENKTYTREEFLERKEVYTNRIALLTDELSMLKPPRTEEYQAKIITFKDTLKSLENPEHTISDKNYLLKNIIEKIEYTNNSGIELDIHYK